MLICVILLGILVHVYHIKTDWFSCNEAPIILYRHLNVNRPFFLLLRDFIRDGFFFLCHISIVIFSCSFDYISINVYAYLTIVF